MSERHRLEGAANELRAFFLDAVPNINAIGEWCTEDDRVMDRLGEIQTQLAALPPDTDGWRPIAEAHEDHGYCNFICLTEDMGIQLSSTLDDDYAEELEWYGWTHFKPVALSTETAALLLARLTLEESC